MSDFSSPGGDFAAFYERHYAKVYRICFAFMKNSFDAEDCTADVFIKVMDALPSLESESHAEGWLSVTAMNLCRDRLRRWRRRRVTSLEALGEPASPPFKTDETLDAVLRLPPKYKEVVYLHYYAGYQTDEIAEMLGRPASTVRNQLRDARARLRDALGGEWE